MAAANAVVVVAAVVVVLLVVLVVEGDGGKVCTPFRICRFVMLPPVLLWMFSVLALAKWEFTCKTKQRFIKVR